MTEHANAAALYILHCGGCHGIEGTVETSSIPRLKDRVGYLLCTPQGRRYAVRLPNVARLAVSDNESLTALVNFVMFDLAGSSAPAAASRYSVAEVALLRRSPMSGSEVLGVTASRRHIGCALQKIRRGTRRSD